VTVSSAATIHEAWLALFHVPFGLFFALSPRGACQRWVRKGGWGGGLAWRRGPIERVRCGTGLAVLDDERGYGAHRGLRVVE